MAVGQVDHEMRRGDTSSGATIARRRASFDKGIQPCERSLQLFDPRAALSVSSTVVTGAATIGKAKDVMTEALTCLREGIGDPKQLVFANRMLAYQYSFLGEPIKALEIRKEVVALATAVPSVWRVEDWEHSVAQYEVDLAYLLWDLGRYTEAERLYDTALEKGRREEEGYLCMVAHACAVQLAKMALYRRHYARALDLLSEAEGAVRKLKGKGEFSELGKFNQDERYVEMWTVRGNVYEALGDMPAVWRCDSEALQLMSKHKAWEGHMNMLAKGVEALRRTGQHLWTCGSLPQAERCLTDIRNLFKNVFKLTDARINKRDLASRCSPGLELFTRFLRAQGRTKEADEVMADLEETRRRYEQLSEEVLQQTRALIEEGRRATTHGEGEGEKTIDELLSTIEGTAAAGDRAEGANRTRRKKHKRRAKQPRAMPASTGRDVVVSVMSGIRAAEVSYSVVSAMEALSVGAPLESNELKSDAGDTAEDDDEEKDLECAVCLCRLTAVDGPGPQLVCRHTYHSGCLDQWLRTCEAKGHPLLCPTCRQPVLFEGP